MKGIKKVFMFVFAVIVGCGSLLGFTGCGKNKDDGKIKIVCTIFSEYDWVQEVIAGESDKFSVTLLLDSGADLHNFQPTVADIAKVSKCDLFVYVGGESDEWVENALDKAQNKNMKTINLMEVLGDNALNEDHDEGHDHDDEYDEHVWLSLKNAQLFVTEIANKVAELDSSNKDTYLENARKYNESLSALDNEYAEAVANGAKNALLFGDRFPFKYLVNDYNLSYFSAFSGCSAETEASFATIARLAGKVGELNLKVILKVESSSDDIAKQIRQSTATKDQEILVMDSLQSATTASNKKYLDVMRSNLEVLKQALR